MSNEKRSQSVSGPETVLTALDGALKAVRGLTTERLAAKLSVSHLVGVARELREIIKIMSIYGV